MKFIVPFLVVSALVAFAPMFAQQVHDDYRPLVTRPYVYPKARPYYVVPGHPHRHYRYVAPVPERDMDRPREGRY
jgi:hypothetical protein